MTIEEAIRWFDSLSVSGIKPGLERENELLCRLGEPQKKMKYIHAAGTNGKGSFCCEIACILSRAGFRTGLFTSPYVLSLQEQLRVDGKEISKEELAGVLTKVRLHAQRMSEPPTQFEVLTAAALLYFAEKECDFAVLECGMGGEGDCTNVIPSPEVAALLSVSLDHTAFLGGTVKEIAQNKCGIIKKGCTAVCYPALSFAGTVPQHRDALAAFKEKCEKEGASYRIADFEGMRLLSDDLSGSTLSTPFGEVRLPFPGIHQVANFACVCAAVRALRDRGFSVRDSDVILGVRDAYMPARLEILSEKPLILVDGGHNPACADAVSRFIKEKLSGKRLILLCAVMKDKDIGATLPKLTALSEEAVFTELPMERSEKAEALYEKLLPSCQKASFNGECRAAFRSALAKTGDDGALLVCGSFYLAREVCAMVRDELRTEWRT